jgi:hypothetical protein
LRYLLLFLLIVKPLLAQKNLLSSNEDIYKEYQTYNSAKNFTSLDDWLYKDYMPYDINLNQKLDDREKNLFKDTLYLQVFMLGTVAVLYMMPTSITKWEEDPDDDRDLFRQRSDHVEDGPVWDIDDWAINYIGHPVSGAWYYMIARERGFGELDSFFYSVILSTFFWEYGYESFAEIPSIQDLIFTPGFGAIMGEGFWILQQKLDRNHGLIWGSKTLGNIAYFFLNPIGRITDNMDNFFNAKVEFRYLTYKPQAMMHISPYLQEIDYVPTNYGFVIDIKF